MVKAKIAMGSTWISSEKVEKISVEAKLQWQSCCNIEMYQTNMLYTLNLYNVICQLYLNKAGEKEDICCWSCSDITPNKNVLLSRRLGL